MSNIGLNVIETDGTASPAIQGAATSVAGFAIQTPRGPVGMPVLITRFDQFEERFGSPDANSDGPLLVQGFFANGGRRAWVSRVGSVATPGGAATGKMLTAGANPTDLLSFTAGTRGDAERGTWGNGLQVWIAPSAETALREVATTVTATGTALKSVRGFVKGDVVALKGTAGATQLVTLATVNAGTGAVTWTPSIVDLTPFTSATKVAHTNFDLTVLAKKGAEMVTVETWPELTLKRDADNYIVTQMNHIGRGSKWVVAKDLRAVGETGAALVPATNPASPTILATGTNPVPADSDYALTPFDKVQVQLIGLDTSDPDVIQTSLAYCELRGDCMLVASVPEGTSVEGAAEFAARFRGKKVYGALYAPWVKVVDPTPGATALATIPPTGHIMGVYARIEAARGIHKAPAGDEARLLGVVEVESQLSDADHTFLVRDGAVNGVRAVPGAGIVVDASRTLSSDTRWLYVNVRLLFNYVKSSLRDGLRWVRQEPNKQDLWDSVRLGTVRPFLMGLWRQGAFGTGEPDEVFTIVCDESNNPPDEVDKGNFRLQVTFWPSKPAETVVIVVGQQPAGGAASEA